MGDGGIEVARIYRRYNEPRSPRELSSMVYPDSPVRRHALPLYHSINRQFPAPLLRPLCNPFAKYLSSSFPRTGRALPQTKGLSVLTVAPARGGIFFRWL